MPNLHTWNKQLLTVSYWAQEEFLFALWMHNLAWACRGEGHGSVPFFLKYWRLAGVALLEVWESSWVLGWHASFTQSELNWSIWVYSTWQIPCHRCRPKHSQGHSPLFLLWYMAVFWGSGYFCTKESMFVSRYQVIFFWLGHREGARINV